jgi:hypothetical protein
MLGARLDQKWTLSETMHLSLPLALILEGAGLNEALEEAPWILAVPRLEADSGRLAASLGCRGDCTNIMWQAAGTAAIDNFRVGYLGGRLDTASTRVLQWEPSLDDGWYFFDGFQVPNIEPDDVGTTHQGTLGWSYARLRADVGARFEISSGQMGMVAANALQFPEVGLSVGMRAGWQPHAADWGVMVGLVNLR